MTIDQAMSRLAFIWPHRTADDNEERYLTRFYERALADLTPAEVAEAVDHAIMFCKFFPTPAELRAFARPPAPKRDLEAEFDLIAGQRANAETVPPARQLGPGPRHRDYEALKAATLAAIRAGGEKVRAERPTASQKLARVIEGYTPLATNPVADALLLDVPARMAQGLADYERSRALQADLMRKSDAAAGAAAAAQGRSGAFRQELERGRHSDAAAAGRAGGGER